VVFSGLVVQVCIFSFLTRTLFVHLTRGPEWPLFGQDEPISCFGKVPQTHPFLLATGPQHLFLYGRIFSQHTFKLVPRGQCFFVPLKSRQFFRFSSLPFPPFFCALVFLMCSWFDSQFLVWKSGIPTPSGTPPSRMTRRRQSFGFFLGPGPNSHCPQLTSLPGSGLDSELEVWNILSNSHPLFFRPTDPCIALNLLSSTKLFFCYLYPSAAFPTPPPLLHPQFPLTPFNIPSLHVFETAPSPFLSVFDAIGTFPGTVSSESRRYFPVRAHHFFIFGHFKFSESHFTSALLSGGPSLPGTIYRRVPDLRPQIMPVVNKKPFLPSLDFSLFSRATGTKDICLPSLTFLIITLSITPYVFSLKSSFRIFNLFVPSRSFKLLSRVLQVFLPQPHLPPRSPT